MFTFWPIKGGNISGIIYSDFYPPKRTIFMPLCFEIEEKYRKQNNKLMEISNFSLSLFPFSLFCFPKSFPAISFAMNISYLFVFSRILRNLLRKTHKDEGKRNWVSVVKLYKTRTSLPIDNLHLVKLLPVCFFFFDFVFFTLVYARWVLRLFLACFSFYQVFGYVICNTLTDQSMVFQIDVIESLRHCSVNQQIIQLATKN